MKSLARFFVLWLAGLFLVCNVSARGSLPMESISIRSLPPEARHVLVLIRQGGPFPHAKDGSVFGNYEGLLPKQKRGYYLEFTVKTPEARNRGARRIVTGGPLPMPNEYFYTDNHYATFKRIAE